jgi:hypothetical protein
LEVVAASKPVLTPEHKRWSEAVAALAAGKTTIEGIKEKWTVSDEVSTKLAEEATSVKSSEQ